MDSLKLPKGSSATSSASGSNSNLSGSTSASASAATSPTSSNTACGGMTTASSSKSPPGLSNSNTPITVRFNANDDSLEDILQSFHQNTHSPSGGASGGGDASPTLLGMKNNGMGLNAAAMTCDSLSSSPSHQQMQAALFSNEEVNLRNNYMQGGGFFNRKSCSGLPPNLNLSKPPPQQQQQQQQQHLHHQQQPQQQPQPQQRRSDVPMYNCAMEDAADATREKAAATRGNAATTSSSSASSAMGSLHMQFAAVAGNNEVCDSGNGSSYGNLSGAGASADHHHQQYSQNRHNLPLPPSMGNCDASSNSSNVTLQSLDAFFNEMGPDYFSNDMAFVSINPPDDNDYPYALNANEGIDRLFDFGSEPYEP